MSDSGKGNRIKGITPPSVAEFRWSEHEKGRRRLPGDALLNCVCATRSGFENYWMTTVTARRFCAQLPSSDPIATGRSLP